MPKPPRRNEADMSLTKLRRETGSMNSLVHQWVYKDAADRAARRAEMMKDPEWLNYVRKLAESGLLMDQQTSLMVPAKFSPQLKK